MVVFPRVVCGEPTVTFRPQADQKFHRNKQAGGGAYIPAQIKIRGPQKYETEVLSRVRATLAECENGREMSVEVDN